MINFWIAIRNPFPCEPFRSLWNREWKISRYKVFELQLSRYMFNLLELQFDLNWRQTDHAGPALMINVFGLTLDVRIYDTRHWDDDTNSWSK